MQNFTHSSEALEYLKQKGFTKNLMIKDDKIFCVDEETFFNPADLKIVYSFRFEGKTNPDDMSVVYGIDCNNGNKGVIIDAFGPKANPLLSQIPLVE